MTDSTYEQELLEHIRKLNEEKRQRVLEFVKGLERPTGTPGQIFLERTKDITISADDLETMQRVIEEDLERIEPDEWDIPS